ncbi:hypothetical protein SCUP234_07406 [Seiridium cupressi]
MCTTPTAEQMHYMEDHVNEASVPSIYISSGILAGASTIAIILRFLARRMSRSCLGKDDYTIFIGYIFHVLYSAGNAYMTRYGHGRHGFFTTDPKPLVIGAITIASTYYFGIALVKYSILFLYHRIFSGKTFRNALLVTAALITAWFVPTFVIGVSMYLPIEPKWDSSVNGTCIEYGKAMVAMGVINIMIDFLVLAIPMPILWKCKRLPGGKLFFRGAFATGGIACVVSIARLTYASAALTSYDPSCE